MTNYTARLADLSNERDGEAVLSLLDAYAADPMGDGQPLRPEVKSSLLQELRSFPTTVIFLAFAGETPVGLAVCFLGFSTFAARPLLNLHDFYVAPGHRGSGVSRLLMSTLEGNARERGCCKLSLEVQEKNARARKVYAAAGFQQALYTSEAGGSLFCVKPLGK